MPSAILRGSSQEQPKHLPLGKETSKEEELNVRCDLTCDLTKDRERSASMQPPMEDEMRFAQLKYEADEAYSEPQTPDTNSIIVQTCKGSQAKIISIASKLW